MKFKKGDILINKDLERIRTVLNATSNNDHENRYQLKFDNVSNTSYNDSIKFLSARYVDDNYIIMTKAFKILFNKKI